MTCITCKEALIIASNKALANGDIALHIRIVTRLIPLCTK